LHQYSIMNNCGNRLHAAWPNRTPQSTTIKTYKDRIWFHQLLCLQYMTNSNHLYCPPRILLQLRTMLYINLSKFSRKIEPIGRRSCVVDKSCVQINVKDLDALDFNVGARRYSTNDQSGKGSEVERRLSTSYSRLSSRYRSIGSLFDHRCGLQTRAPVSRWWW